MHATGGEWAWSVLIGLALLASLDLARQAWFDWRVTTRTGPEDLRHLVSIEALSNQAVPVLFLTLLFGLAASSLFVESAAGPISARGLFIRWGSVSVSVITVLLQFAGLRRRRRMLGYARGEAAGESMLQKVAADAAAALAMINIVHTLVNSNLTASIQAELSSTKRELALLASQSESAEAIAVAEARIAELEALLAERQKQAEQADEQIKAERERIEGE